MTVVYLRQLDIFETPRQYLTRNSFSMPQRMYQTSLGGLEDSYIRGYWYDYRQNLSRIESNLFTSPHPKLLLKVLLQPSKSITKVLAAFPTN